MDVILRLEDRYGGRWCGVEFGGNENGKGIKAAQPIPFCEAVGQPGMWPIGLEGVHMPHLHDCGVVVRVIEYHPAHGVLDHHQA